MWKVSKTGKLRVQNGRAVVGTRDAERDPVALGLLSIRSLNIAKSEQKDLARCLGTQSMIAEGSPCVGNRVPVAHMIFQLEALGMQKDLLNSWPGHGYTQNTTTPDGAACSGFIT
jgi:hypothetical protein